MLDVVVVFQVHALHALAARFCWRYVATGRRFT